MVFLYCAPAEAAASEFMPTLTLCIKMRFVDYFTMTGYTHTLVNHKFAYKPQWLGLLNQNQLTP